MTATVLQPSSITGRKPGLAVVAGRVLALAGAVFGLANLFQYGVYSGLLPLHQAALGLSWPIAVMVFVINIVRLRRAGGEAGRRAAGWSRMGIAASLTAALGLLALSIMQKDFGLMAWMTPVGLGLYAIAWATAAFRTRRLWMACQAVGALCLAGLTVGLLGTPDQYLFYAIGLFAFAFAPGIYLILSDKS
ncbi:hypothetical protein GVN24_25655 [Rhizobium sp. CRIBSB]|nr:hypothetical protein [Rhizobium sp. CRIBSB]